MKRILFFLSIFISVFMLCPKSLATPNPVISNVGIQFGFFYSSLAPHGEWIEVASGTRVWRPFHIPYHWRPYLNGRWAWTDYGWYWMSDEPFGWITYHYGRWYYDNYYGWVWMPDDVWAPAWVEWRYNDDYIGWAPLPPYAKFDMTFGIRFTTHWTAPAHYWNVVRYNRFGSIIRYRDTAPEEYTSRLMRTIHPSPQYGIDHDRIINRGVDRDIIERRGNIQFTTTEVSETREQYGERMTRSNENQRIEIYRPTQVEMQSNAERIEVRRGERNLSIDVSNRQQRIESRTPQGPVRQSQRDRQEMRRKLIQRHEYRQRPSPPTIRKSRQSRMERRKDSSQITRPRNPTQEKRSENKSER